MPNQQEIMIKLLGRIAFKKDGVVSIVTFKKSARAQNYIKGYNACDGNHSVIEIARIVGVKSGTLSPILKQWEEEGIVYTIKKSKGKFYKKIFSI